MSASNRRSALLRRARAALIEAADELEDYLLFCGEKEIRDSFMGFVKAARRARRVVKSIDEFKSKRRGKCARA